MADSQNTIVVGFGSLLFWGFIAVKAFGHSFAAWSWWWVLLPIFPWFGLLIQHFNL